MEFFNKERNRAVNSPFGLSGLWIVQTLIRVCR